MSKKGGKNPFWGKHHTEESKKKMSLAKMGNTNGFKKGHSVPKEWRRNLSNALKGEKNPHWKNGITPLRRQIRRCFEYRQWRSDIFTRDDFSCVLCGKRGSHIEADHYPKRFVEILEGYQIKTLEEAENCEELWSINNGRTLCLQCRMRLK